jgi:hypothetical protein
VGGGVHRAAVIAHDVVVREVVLVCKDLSLQMETHAARTGGDENVHRSYECARRVKALLQLL